MNGEQDVDENVSKVVRMLAIARDETVEHAAESVGMSRDTIYRRLRGKGEWKVRELRALADHFGVPVAVFIDGPGGAFGGRGQISAHLTTEMSDFPTLADPTPAYADAA